MLRAIRYEDHTVLQELPSECETEVRRKTRNGTGKEAV